MSKIILGTVQFGIHYGINNKYGKPSSEKVNEMLNFAFDNGVRYLDTAEVYGDAHSIIGSFHNENPHKKFNIITKFPHDCLQNFDGRLETYLDQLNVDNIYALLFHSFETYKNNCIIEKLIDFKKKGLLKHIGVSIYTNEQFEFVINDDNIDIIQLPFNILDNVNQRGLLIELAKSKNKIIHTRSAFLQGLFFMPISAKFNVVQKLKIYLNKIQNQSLKSGLSIDKIALAYCLNQSNIDNVLIGVDNIEQLNNNLKHCDIHLNNETLNVINKIFVKDTDLLNPTLWKF